MKNISKNTKRNDLCFVCGNRGHKARHCILNEKRKRMFQEPCADAFTTPVYDSLYRSRSPMVRSSRDDEITQSENNISLTERDPASIVVKTFAVYIGNIPNDWTDKDVKIHIINKLNWHAPAASKYLTVIILKEKNHKTSYCKVAKVILGNQKLANIIVKGLTNKKCNGNKLKVTQNPEAPFLKDKDTNTIDIENEIKNMKDEMKKARKSRKIHAAHGPNRDNNFENLYGLSREYLSSLGITPPLQSSIFVAGFDPEKVDEEKLHEVFSLAGQVVLINIFRKNDGTPKNCAIISFDHPIEAVQAISMFSNQSLYGNNLTINLSSARIKFTPPLPEGLTKLGPGLGPDGKVMRNVRTTVELEPLKQLLHTKLATNRADSTTDLENYVFHNAYFQQNAPTMAGANETIVDPMALNAAVNTMMQNGAMTIIAQNSVMNPAMSVMNQNSAMNHMIQNTTMNPMIHNTFMNSIVLNDSMNPMALNADMNPMTHNPSINSMTQNFGMNQIHQNVGMNQITHNADMNHITPNASMNQIPQNVGINQITTNAGMNPMIQNAGTNPIAQNAVRMTPMAQNHDITASNLMINQMQNYVQQKNSCDSEGKDNAEKENGSNILLFTNLPSSVDEIELKSKMRKVGKLLYVRMMEQGRAIVSYEQSRDADTCIRMFHKCKVDGQVIEVKSI